MHVSQTGVQAFQQTLKANILAIMLGTSAQPLTAPVTTGFDTVNKRYREQVTNQLMHCADVCHVLTWLAQHAHCDVARLVREQRAWLGLGPESTHGCEGSGKEAGWVLAGEQALCSWEEVVDDALVHLQDEASKQGGTGQSFKCDQVCGLQPGDEVR